MIKFFRKIRQNLLSEGKTRKYLKYAIGEIFLVVIGILLALQINTWNRDYQDSKREVIILKKLKNNIQVDTATFNDRITDIQSYLNKLNIIENEISNDQLDNFSINIIEPLLGVVRMNLETTTWENLKSTGEINLLRNAELTENLQDYYIQFKNNSKSWTEGFKEYNRNILAPKFFEFDDFSMFGPDSEYMDEDIQKKQPFTYGQSIFFRNALRYRKGALQSIINTFEEDLSRSKNVLSILNEEIKE